jgi:two-component system response regulator YesN
MKRSTLIEALAPKREVTQSSPLIRHTLFWQLFANYFLLILIPVIVASVLAYVLVVRIIEEDAERFNNVIMSHFAERTDTELQSLKNNMINMLSASNIRSVLRIPVDLSSDHMQRIELLHSLREQLQQLESNKLVGKAYFYFVYEDLIIDADTYTNKSYYFSSMNALGPSWSKDIDTTLTGKKMMDFMENPASLTAIMSYPFNTLTPEVYLLVDIKADKLKEQIYISEDWVKGTAIVDESGRLIAHTGLSKQDQEVLRDRIAKVGLSSQFTISKETGLLLDQSSFDNSWHYISMTDLGTVMKPIYWTRGISLLFSIFFLLVGGIVSYYLSRRLYLPIREIKDGLESHHPYHEKHLHAGNEFEMIKRYSQSIMSENKELFHRVNGMLPIIQEQFVAKIVQGQYQDALSIEYYAKEIAFSYSSNVARTVVSIALHYNTSEYQLLSESKRIFILTELKESLYKLDPKVAWLCQTKPDMLVCVLQQDKLMNQNMEQLAERMKELLLLYGNYFKATIGIGTAMESIEQLSLSYDHALNVLKDRKLDSTVEICNNLNYCEQQVDSFLSIQEVQRILNQYKTREYDKLLEFMLHLLEEGKRRELTALQMKYLCTDVLNTWIRAVESEHHDPNVPYYAGLFEQMNFCMTWEELKHCFQHIHSFLFRVTETSNRSQQFAEIVHYIQEHFNEELSIEYFAGKMNMSSGHFSRTFKEEIGEKYVDYIAKCRLTKAKQFLLETDMKIDEIAEQVGYWGRNSLIRAFNRYEGITPAKYRTFHQ